MHLLKRDRTNVRRIAGAFSMGALAMLGGCKDLVGNQPAPAGTPSPEAYETAAGALLKVTGVRGIFGEAANVVLLNTGLLSDELTMDPAVRSLIDARQLPEGEQSDGATMYNKVQNLRVQAALAALAMQRAFPDSLQAIRGEMYAVQGYAELWLADVFCAGSPLSMPVEGADYQYGQSLPRDSIFAHALGLFDSAVVLTRDSANIAVLAKVGRARTLLSLDSAAQAASSVATVQDADQYVVRAIVGGGIRTDGGFPYADFGSYSVADREGEVGLAYRSSLDPRTQSFLATTLVQVGDPADNNQRTVTTYNATKYQQSRGDSSLYVVANGIEARLIEAEADLRSGQIAQWLGILNALRTEWNTAAGDPAALPPLTDPGSALSGAAATKARVDTLFAERAAWLFLTGHRQSDLRRLMQQYPNEGNVFPHGAYPALGGYGNAVKFAIPTTEKYNPYYHGCLD